MKLYIIENLLRQIQQIQGKRKTWPKERMKKMTFVISCDYIRDEMKDFANDFISKHLSKKSCPARQGNGLVVPRRAQDAWDLFYSQGSRESLEILLLIIFRKGLQVYPRGKMANYLSKFGIMAPFYLTSQPTKTNFFLSSIQKPDKSYHLRCCTYIFIVEIKVS